MSKIAHSPTKSSERWAAVVVAVCGLVVLLSLAAQSAQAAVNLDYAPLSVSLGGSLMLVVTQDPVQPSDDIRVSPPDALATGRNEAFISTTNPSGAKLELSMADGQTTNALLSGGTAEIAATAGGATLGDNAWGYYAYDTALAEPSAPTWAAMPLFDSPTVLISPTLFDTAGSFTYAVVYGVTVTFAQAADTYTNQVTYTASSNP
jgi:hypothetical protein